MNYINGVCYLDSEDTDTVISGIYFDLEYINRMMKTFGLTCQKISYRRGYIKRKVNNIPVPCIVTRYDGLYGRGYCVHVSTTRSTAYHEVHYYTKN